MRAFPLMREITSAASAAPRSSPLGVPEPADQLPVPGPGAVVADLADDPDLSGVEQLIADPDRGAGLAGAGGTEAHQQRPPHPIAVRGGLAAPGRLVRDHRIAGQIRPRSRRLRDEARGVDSAPNRAILHHLVVAERGERGGMQVREHAPILPLARAPGIGLPCRLCLVDEEGELEA